MNNPAAIYKGIVPLPNGSKGDLEVYFSPHAFSGEPVQEIHPKLSPEEYAKLENAEPHPWPGTRIGWDDSDSPERAMYRKLVGEISKKLFGGTLQSSPSRRSKDKDEDEEEEE
jgi:hypothetical protein